MATGDRRRFLPLAFHCFARRTYRRAELIVIDDGERSVERLCAGRADVRYLRVRPMNLGAKLNLGIEAARGRLIQKIDDDDYYGPRLLAQAERALRGTDPERTLATRCCFLTLVGAGRTLRHSGHGWTPGGAFCFDRALWRRTPFQDRAVSEDAHLLKDHRPEVIRICDAEQYIVVRHGGNTWRQVRIKATGTDMSTEAYFRSLPRHERTVEQVLTPGAYGLCGRALGWKRRYTL
jgi:glycosyltransferase involved in cell wall biosynthesis